MKIIVVGAGAAGMMAVATLIEQWTPGSDIHLFDGNTSLGRKVAITGGGRCNVTTGIISKKELMPKYIRGANFLAASFIRFGPKKVREWFEANGLRLKVEDDMRVFPVSDRGEEVVEIFARMFDRAGVSFHGGEKVVSVEKTQDGYEVKTSKDSYFSDILVITTGGNAYSHTGSVGDGYSFARSLGHTVTPLAPSLSSFLATEPLCAELSGLAFPTARIETVSWKYRVEWPILFTHFGISGPAVFAFSAHVAFEKIDEAHSLQVRIIPDISHKYDVFDRELSEQFALHPTRTLRNALTEYYPRRLVDGLLQMFSLDGEKHSARVSRDERKQVVGALCNGISLTLVSRRPGDEFVTAGGVELSEINPETMESRIHPRLYFAGELLDVDAVTGGFNLQACWATGRMAGEGMVGQLRVRS